MGRPALRGGPRRLRPCASPPLRGAVLDRARHLCSQVMTARTVGFRPGSTCTRRQTWDTTERPTIANATVSATHHSTNVAALKRRRRRSKFPLPRGDHTMSRSVLASAGGRCSTSDQEQPDCLSAPQLRECPRARPEAVSQVRRSSRGRVFLLSSLRSRFRRRKQGSGDPDAVLGSKSHSRRVDRRPGGRGVGGRPVLARSGREHVIRSDDGNVRQGHVAARGSEQDSAGRDGGAIEDCVGEL